MSCIYSYYDTHIVIEMFKLFFLVVLEVHNNKTMNCGVVYQHISKGLYKFGLCKASLKMHIFFKWIFIYFSNDQVQNHVFLFV